MRCFFCNFHCFNFTSSSMIQLKVYADFDIACKQFACICMNFWRCSRIFRFKYCFVPNISRFSAYWEKDKWLAIVRCLLLKLSSVKLLCLRCLMPWNLPKMLQCHWLVEKVLSSGTNLIWPLFGDRISAVYSSRHLGHALIQSFYCLMQVNVRQ